MAITSRRRNGYVPRTCKQCGPCFQIHVPYAHICLFVCLLSCVPLHIPPIPTVHIEDTKEEHHSALPLNQFTIVNFDGHVQKQLQQHGKKKKKKIIIQEDDELDDSDSACTVSRRFGVDSPLSMKFFYTTSMWV